MVETILQIFMSEQQAQSILANPLIEFIFMVLFVTFGLAIFVHFLLYSRLKRVRHHINVTNSLDIDPLRYFKVEFEEKKKKENVKVDTFVQKKFSSWRIFNVPVINLIKMVQMTVSIFILVGVLGTFIGLATSLGSIDATGDQLVENVASVLGGIDVAFYTSIAGMGLSLIMTVVTRVANAEYLLTDIMLKTESFLEEEEQDPMNRLIDVSETINDSIVQLRETNQQSLQKIEQSFQGFQEYTDGLQKSAEDLAKFNDGLSKNLQDFTILFEDIKAVTEGFDGAVAMLNKNFDQLFFYFKQMDKRNERMANAFENTYKKIEELSSTQMKTLNEFEASVQDWKGYMSSVADRQEAIQVSFENIYNQSDQLVKLMDKNNKQFKGIFGDNLNSQLSAMNDYFRSLKSDFDKLGNSIVHLPSALETLNETQAQYKHLLSDRFDELKQFNQEFHEHLKAHAAESKAFEKQLNDATRSYEQLGVKNQQLLDEMNRTITQMTDSFKQREDQIEASVDVLKDTLSRYVNNLEGTLGEKFDKVSKNIGENVVDMNSVLKKEMKKIGEITEDTQQISARQTQQTINDLQQEFQTLNHQLKTLTEEATAAQSYRVRVGSND
ncbi:MotA/TolQ/ExbB proton channel family protein [Texcoconibacillus texcoconensis]|uniref:Chromosome segregation ATPase n=1 Tax=Texcoconibacillus texcoconensis TaxID=1095777 RepID=A0A840QRE9_9BACI|nr:MotA/TolQ/ExbB proton channel family protein [Texcoconibacillus texcoconensis]MBB5174042.1 chromosome segregation ATPase [Texcoconibacillus texcoconensis]